MIASATAAPGAHAGDDANAAFSFWGKEQAISRARIYRNAVKNYDDDYTGKRPG